MIKINKVLEENSLKRFFKSNFSPKQQTGMRYDQSLTFQPCQALIMCESADNVFHSCFSVKHKLSDQQVIHNTCSVAPRSGRHFYHLFNLTLIKSLRHRRDSLSFKCWSLIG